MKEERLEKFIKSIIPLNLVKEKFENAIIAFLDSDGMYRDLIKAGFTDRLDYPHLQAFISAEKPLPDAFVNVIMMWLPKVKKPFGILEMLRESENRYDGSFLISLFSKSNANERWKIADAIAYNPPLYIDDWVKETYLSAEYGQEAGLLSLAIVKMFPLNEARAILKQGFDLHPEVTPEALGIVGLAEDIYFLEEKYKATYKAKFIYKEIEKAIKKIKKRYKV